MRSQPIYLDNLATTRTDPRVVAAMLPYFTEVYGNASSVSHKFGWDAEEAVSRSRRWIAEFIGAEEREIVFTSGATESNNLAIKGLAGSLQGKKNHLISSSVEHRAVLDPMKTLKRSGWDVTILPCDSFGMVHPDQVRDAITEQTALVSVIYANNEIGTINPIAEIGRACRERGVVLHTDATQAVGKIPVDVNADFVDLMSFSAHKFYGPKGIGALFVRRRQPQVRLLSLLDGGGHERGFRSGTLAVPFIVGMTEALRIAMVDLGAESERLGTLRDHLQNKLMRRFPDTMLNGHPSKRLSGALNLTFKGVDGESLMMAMREVAVSSGSACTSAEPEPSHVLRSIGRDEDQARASLRFGLGRFTTAEEVDFAVQSVANAIEQLIRQNAQALIQGS